MFMDFLQRKVAGQCQQEQSGALGVNDDRLAKSLLLGRAPISNALFNFLKIVIGGV
jgi:hypothetical protein